MRQGGTGRGAILILAAGLAAGAPARSDEAAPPTWRLSRHAVPAARQSVRRAADKLRRPACAALLAEFRDADGRSLHENLGHLGTDVHGFLDWLVLVNGENTRPCLRSTTTIFTEPGSRVVRVCEGRFVAAERTDPERAAVLVIHEMFHSLGLGENPPSSAEITARIAARCGG